MKHPSFMKIMYSQLFYPCFMFIMLSSLIFILKNKGLHFVRLNELTKAVIIIYNRHFFQRPCDEKIFFILEFFHSALHTAIFGWRRFQSKIPNGSAKDSLADEETGNRRKSRSRGGSLGTRIETFIYFKESILSVFDPNIHIYSIRQRAVQIHGFYGK